MNLNRIASYYYHSSSSFIIFNTKKKKFSVANTTLTFLSRFRSNILPLSSLCIHRGKSVWVLYVDATCINYDGNAFDATLLAMVAALKNSTFYLYSEDPFLLFFFLLTRPIKQHFLKQPSTSKRMLPSAPDELPNYLFN